MICAAPAYLGAPGALLQYRHEMTVEMHILTEMQRSAYIPRDTCRDNGRVVDELKSPMGWRLNPLCGKLPENATYTEQVECRPLPDVHSKPTAVKIAI